MSNGTFLISSTQCATPGGGTPSLSWVLTGNGTVANGVVGGFANCDTNSDLEKSFLIEAEGGFVDAIGNPLSFTASQGAAVNQLFTLPSGRGLTISGTAESFSISATVLPFSLTVTLSVTNSCGFTSAPSSQFVKLLAPAANASFTLTSPSPGVYDFTDTSSAGGCGGGITSWAWSVPGKVEGVDYSFTNGTTSASQNPQITFNSYATYTVRLEIVTACGSTQSTTQAIAYNNAPPEAQSVSVSGSYAQGQTLTGTYTYYDSDGDLEGVSGLVWYRSDDAGGLINKTQLGTGNSYTTTATEAGKYVFWEVSPVAATGSLVGTPVSTTPTLVGSGVATIHDQYHDQYHS